MIGTLTAFWQFIDNQRDQRKIKNTISEPLGQTVDGNYSSYLQVLSVTLTYKFDSFFLKKKEGLDLNKKSNGE